jgi:DNA-directed RNA polymerase subunit RPC12/RpoP
MPIRFRCAYCNQLMAIARRKAGTVVRCPTCSGQVVVPHVESSNQPPAAPPGSTGGATLEGNDFNQLFKMPVSGPSGSSFEGGPPPFLTPDQSDRYRPAGILLTPAKGLLLVLIIAVLLGLAFLGGFLAGQGG